MDFDTVYRMGPEDGYYGPPEPDFEHCLTIIESANSVGLALEMACGDGRHSRVLCRRGWKTLGIDLSMEGLISAKKTCGHLFAGVRADGRTDFITRPFDLLVSTTLIDHVPPWEVDGIIQLMRDRIRPGGYFYLTAFNDWDPESPQGVRSFRGLAERGSDTASAIVNFFKPGQLVEHFRDWEILHYAEVFSLALHSPAHSHGFSVVCGRAPDA